MERKCYHICNRSFKVLFRDLDDFFMAINKLAVALNRTGDLILSLTIQSTHLHFTILSNNPIHFIEVFSIAYTRYFNNKYKNKGRIFFFSYRELKTTNEILVATNYTLKNPLHHNITGHPLFYKFSSIRLYFSNLLYGEEYYEDGKDGHFGKMCSHTQLKPSELSYSEKRKLFGSEQMSDKYIVIDRRVVSLDTIVEIHTVEVLYKTVRNFLYNMNCQLQEEKGNLYTEIDTSFLISNKISDIDICKFINQLIGFPESGRTYKMLSDDEIKYIMKYFLNLKVPPLQIKRCL